MHKHEVPDVRHQIQIEDLRVQRDHPLEEVHLGLHLVLLEVLAEVGQVQVEDHLKHLHALHHLPLVDQKYWQQIRRSHQIRKAHKGPYGLHLHKKQPAHERHALHLAHIRPRTNEGHQNLLQTLEQGTFRFKQLQVRKGAGQVQLYHLN